MVSRRISGLRRDALTGHIRASIQSGRLAPGAKLPSLRTLAGTFGLSAPTVLDELQTLIAEGALVAVAGTGIFVADSAPEARPAFLFVHPPRGVGTQLHHQTSIRLGFEETMSDLGGATLSLSREDLDGLAIEDLPAVDGVVSWLVGEATEEMLDALKVPQVRIGQYRAEDEHGSFDTVALDDHAGGRLGTTHLLRRGYSRIAFLALHPASGDKSGNYRFSEDRLTGWLDTLRGAQRPHTGLAFHPDQPVADYRTAIRAAEATAERMADHRDEFDAVLAADDNAVLGFATAWHRIGVPDAEWPTIIGFEGVDAARRYVTSSIIPQWRELGEHAANLLWSRHHGTLRTPPTHRLASMKFVARITSEQGWSAGTRQRLLRATHR